MILISKFLKDKNVPERRSAFAIEHGAYVGEFFVFIEQVKDVYFFLSLPKMEIREVTKASYLAGIESKVMVPVEKLPYQVFKTCLQQFKKAKNEQKSNNRHTKSPVPNLPHQQAG